MTRLLVLGGTTFVGRWTVTEALNRGWSVTTFNRGRAAWHHPAASRVLGDRHNAADLARLQDDSWDAVVDTWAGAPRVVRESATALAGSADRYLYVSSRAVYAFPTPTGMDERSATVEASPEAGDTEYTKNKRGGELAVVAAFGDRALLARAGPILGPHEATDQLPRWVRKLSAGGRVLAPGPADRPWRFVDVRDLAAWMLDALDRGLGGPVNLVNPEGHTTTRSLLTAVVAATGSDTELVWVDAEAIAVAMDVAGLDRWAELPGWIPPDPAYSGFIWTDVSRALATGLTCRPVEQTVAETCAWLQREHG
jgi:nucleoside-diphosphate-sugar epimerase